MRQRRDAILAWLATLACLAAGPGAAPPAQAAYDLAGEMRAVVESYDDPASGEAAVPFYSYLRLDLRETGEGADDRYVLYGRIATDLADQISPASRLYYAYWERRGVWKGADLRVGRQLVNTVAGSPVLDGALLKAQLGGFTTRLFGGRQVAFDEAQAEALTWGAAVSRPFGSADLSLSYLQKWEEGDLLREFVGGSASLPVFWHGTAYGEFQYDLLSQVWGWYLAGLRVAPTDRLTLRAEYLGTTPVFDSTDIYSVFAVEDYQEASLKADFRLTREWVLFGGYTREFYEEFADNDVLEAGVELRRPSALHGYLAAVVRTGDEELTGVKASVGGNIGWGISADAGVEVDVYTRTGADDEDTSASRYWVEGRKGLASDVTLSGRLERIESVVYDYYNRGRLSLAYRF